MQSVLHHTCRQFGRDARYLICNALPCPFVIRRTIFSRNTRRPVCRKFKTERGKLLADLRHQPSVGRRQFDPFRKKQLLAHCGIIAQQAQIPFEQHPLPSPPDIHDGQCIAQSRCIQAVAQLQLPAKPGRPAQFETLLHRFRFAFKKCLQSTVHLIEPIGQTCIPRTGIDLIKVLPPVERGSTGRYTSSGRHFMHFFLNRIGPERIKIGIDADFRLPINGSFPVYGDINRTVDLEIHQRHHAQFTERFAHRCIEYLPDRLFVLELYFRLLRMHVHIDPLRCDGQVEEIGRLRLRGNQFLIGLKHRFMKIRRAEVTAVYEQVLFPVRLFSHRRMAHVSFDLHDRGLYGHIEQVIGQSFAANAGDPLPQVPRRQAVNQRIVVVKRKFDFGMAQRHPLEFGRQVTRLDGRFLEKTTPGRNIEEKIFNQELRPDGSLYGFLSDECAAVDGHPRAHFRRSGTRTQLHLGHRSDRRKRLAAKTERMQA